jgi:polysaccharide biosynthesis/export protein
MERRAPGDAEGVAREAWRVKGMVESAPHLSGRRMGRLRGGPTALAVTVGLALLGLLPCPLGAQEVATPVEAYRIGSGDRLQLSVWREAELTRELTVRIDGFVTVPLVGDVRAVGLTPAEVASAVQKKLGQYVNNPNVTVGVLAAPGAQFFVVGRVARPGAFPLDKPTRFLHALALAGGFLEFAKTDRVLVFRGKGGVIPVNYKKLESGTDVSDNIPLQSGDTVVVP